MLRCLVCILVVTWCLNGASARPARRPFVLFRSVKPSSTVKPNHSNADQEAEASSFVNEFVAHQGNLLEEGKLDLPRSYSTYSDLEENVPHSFNNDCANCDTLDGIVTLGESRSYSIVTNSRQQDTAKIREPLSDPHLTEFTTQPEVESTTMEPTTAKEETVISVRVSSSMGNSECKWQEPASLLTEERPLATSVQRSHFSVEEAAHESVTSPGSGSSTTHLRQKPPDSDVTTNVSLKTAEAKQIDTSTAKSFLSTNSQFMLQPTLTSRTDRNIFLSSANIGLRFPKQRIPVLTDRQGFVVVENSSPPGNHLSSPISYSTSLQSATSGSSVTFYRESPSLHFSTSQHLTSTESTAFPTAATERLKHETRVETVSFHEEVVVPQRPLEKNTSRAHLNEEKTYQAVISLEDLNYQATQQNVNTSNKKRPYSVQDYGQGENVYGMPEQNYEVEEALSVRTNGRVHGVQGPLSSASDSNKSGYVVEGRNFKKYRVEEKTADGFIVGEYGVVRHDDGSLRGVRYTADSTINPKLIYEALVKFLSL